MNDMPLISTARLAARLGDPEIRVLDASWYLPDHHRDPAAEYLDAHIPGAVPFDIDAVADTRSGLPHTLPRPAFFASAVAALGVGNDHFVVVYDGMGFFSAPRVWWMFRVFGHDRVAVLDGGFPKWRAEGRARDSGPASPAPAPRPFRCEFRGAMVRGLAGMRANRQGPAAPGRDARGPGRLAGAPAQRELRLAGQSPSGDGSFGEGRPSNRHGRGFVLPCVTPQGDRHAGDRVT